MYLDPQHCCTVYCIAVYLQFYYPVGWWRREVVSCPAVMAPWAPVHCIAVYQQLCYSVQLSINSSIILQGGGGGGVLSGSDGSLSSFFSLLLYPFTLVWGLVLSIFGGGAAAIAGPESGRCVPRFFYHLFRKDKSNRPGQLPNGIKHFRIWFRFRRDIPILVSKKLTPHSRYRYHTADSEKYEYLGGNETQNENILTLWSVAQAGSNDDKKPGVANLVGLSL